MELGYIYKITNKKNGKAYIGQSINYRKRITMHKMGNRGCVIHKAITKYGKQNFTYEILERIPQEHLDEREITWIAAFNTFYGEGYNCTPGGQGEICRKNGRKVGGGRRKKGYDYSIEVKSKISDAKKGINIIIGSENKKKYKHSQETKDKISKNNKRHFLGRNHTKEAKDKMSAAHKMLWAKRRQVNMFLAHVCLKNL